MKRVLLVITSLGAIAVLVAGTVSPGGGTIAGGGSSSSSSSSGITNGASATLSGLVVSNNTTTPFTVNGNSSSYTEANVQNFNPLASSDSTQTADLGNANTNYNNQGINNSGYVTGPTVLGAALDTYYLSDSHNEFFHLIGPYNVYWTWQLTGAANITTNATFTPSNGNMNFAGNVSATSFSGSLNATNLNGAVAQSNLLGSTTNTTTTLYNDTNALAYLNSASVYDIGARNDMIRAVNSLKRRGVWSHVVSAGGLEPRFNTTNHFDLLFNAMTFSNEQYDSFGFHAMGTNWFKIPIRNLTNYSLFIVYTEPDAVSLDTFSGNIGGSGQFLGGCLNTNQWSGSAFGPWAAFAGYQIWASSLGTNWNAGLNYNETSNRVTAAFNGGYNNGGVLPMLPMFEGFSSSSNGLMSHWKNGRKSAQISIPTNVVFLSKYTVPLNELFIAGAETNWNGVYGSFSTNAIADVAGWILYDQNSDTDNTNLPQAADEFLTDILNYDTLVVLQGSSVMNNSARAGAGGGSPYTNALAYRLAQQFPRDLVVDEGLGGSSLNNWNTMNAGLNTTWDQNFALNMDLGKYRVMAESDAPRNDAFSGTSVATILPLWHKYYDQLVTNSIDVYLVKTHWAYNQTPAANGQWQTMELAIQSNCVLSGIIDEQSLVSSNLLALVSADNPPVHPNAPTIYGQLFNSAFANALMLRPWPLAWLDNNLNIQAGGLVQDAEITSMSQMRFSIENPLTGAKRLTLDLSAGTNLNGSSIASGTVADARLSGNVALLNASQTFTGGNTFSGGLTNSSSQVVSSNGNGTLFYAEALANNTSGFQAVNDNGTSIALVLPDSSGRLRFNGTDQITFKTGNIWLGNGININGSGSGLTNGFQNTTTYTNPPTGVLITNQTTRNIFVSINARCNPTTTLSAQFALVTSPTGVTFTTNAVCGAEADAIYTTVPHIWAQATTIVPPGGIWEVVDITGAGVFTITNSFYQTMQ